jgi:membrane fusion protein (multidrug efflux system)
VDDPLFRPAALRHRHRRVEDEGRPLRVTPPWVDSLYRLLLVSTLLGFALLLLCPNAEYASGPAIVRLAERLEVTARAGGTIGELLVAPGDRVVAGQVLGRLDDSRQAAGVAKLREQFERLLVERLRAPGAGPPAGGLDALQREIELAEAELELLDLRAPRAGVIGDVLVRTGKPVGAGQLAFTVVSPSPAGGPSVLTLLPGRYRPLLRPGMPMRFTLSGYVGGEQRLTVDHVSASVVDPAEMRALVGEIAGRQAGAGGGWVLVRASLPADYFEVRGRRYGFYDGLIGTAEVAVRTRRLATLLLPWEAAGGEHG